MRITLVLADGSRVTARHTAGERHACATVRCPHGCAPLDRKYPDVIAVAGVGATHGYDTHYASAIALCCRKPIGALEIKVDTLFGIEVDTLFGIDEDTAVLHGRPRVYG